MFFIWLNLILFFYIKNSLILYKNKVNFKIFNKNEKQKDTQKK